MFVCYHKKASSVRTRIQQSSLTQLQTLYSLWYGDIFRLSVHQLSSVICTGNIAAVGYGKCSLHGSYLCTDLLVFLEDSGDTRHRFVLERRQIRSFPGRPFECERVSLESKGRRFFIEKLSPRPFRLHVTSLAKLFAPFNERHEWKTVENFLFLCRINVGHISGNDNETQFRLRKCDKLWRCRCWSTNSCLKHFYMPLERLRPGIFIDTLNYEN